MIANRQSAYQNLLSLSKEKGAAESENFLLYLRYFVQEYGGYYDDSLRLYVHCKCCEQTLNIMRHNNTYLCHTCTKTGTEDSLWNKPVQLVVGEQQLFIPYHLFPYIAP